MAKDELTSVDEAQLLRSIGEAIGDRCQAGSR